MGCCRIQFKAPAVILNHGTGNTQTQTGPLTDPRDARWFRKTGVVKLTYLKVF